MKSKILNLLLLLTSLLGYLEWGGNNHSFLYQAEWEVLRKIFSDPLSVLHPLTVLPMLGQILLLITLFQQKPNKFLTYCSIGALGTLLLLILFIGIMEVNFKMIASAVPFVVVAAQVIIVHLQDKTN